MDAYNLLDESYTTVAVRFYNEDEASYDNRRKTYNYKVPRTWGITVDDLLVVEAANTVRVVKVAEIHPEPQFSGFPKLKWAVGRVDMGEYNELNAREQRFRDALQMVARQKQKDELVEQLKTSAAGSEAARILLGDALAMIGQGGVASVTPPPFAGTR